MGKRTPLFYTGLLLAAVLLTACARPAPPPPTDATTQSTEVFAPIADTMYHDAIRTYLWPLENYSGTRTEKPEFVMLHFSSAVVFSEHYAVDADTIRLLFKGNGVSTHYIVDRDGTVSCCIPEDRVAWHAGKGTWRNDPKYTNRMNHYSIGIELVAIGSQNDMADYLSAAEYARLDPALIGYTEAQYEALQSLVGDICARYDIPMDRQHVMGHEEYSPQKSDPGELFDWDRLLKKADGQ